MLRVLFIVTGALYARPARAIVVECERKGITPFVVPYPDDISPYFTQFESSFWRSARTRSLVTLAVKAFSIARLMLRLRTHISRFEKENFAEYDEFSTERLCCNRLKNRVVQDTILTTFSLIYLQNLLFLTTPDLICLMPDGGLLQQMAATIGKMKKIPLLACSAALENGNARAYMQHLHADKLAAMGEVNKELYAAAGLNPDRIVPTGVAHFDQLFTRDNASDDEELRKHGIDPNRPIILFTTDNISYKETEQMLTGVIDTVNKINGIQLVIKVHPSEDMTRYQQLAGSYENPDIFVGKAIDLYALIHKCEMLITKYSTTALESMMLDKPVITINLSGTPAPVPYAEEGGSLGVFTKEKIEPAIRSILYDEQARAQLKIGRDRFVRRWAGEPDGKASQRIVNLMKEMIESKKVSKNLERIEAGLNDG